VRILALETTENIGGVAAAIDDNLLLQHNLDPQQRSTQSLAPAVKELLENVGWRPRDVELVALTVGPGSFTGLRVGLAMAKVFAYAVGAGILGLDTLEVIAAAAPPEVESLSVAVDAQRGEVVARRFRRGPAADRPTRWFEPLDSAELVPIEEWLASLPTGTTVSGPALRKWRDPLPAGTNVLDPTLWAPTAANVARLAFRDYTAGRRDDLWSLLPVYSRRAAAEEKWEKLGK
jgi:tRNA threonylcarbamoyladenosine biosynthesis protein TsaB